MQKVNWFLVSMVVFACSIYCFAAPPEPHPWLAQAPGEYVRHIDRGNVQIKVDDERIRQSGKSALTLFQFVVDFDFKFRFEWIEANAQKGLWRARITAWMDQPKIRLDHTICIPSTYNPAKPWESKLMKHEFDHIAISTDPRMTKIINRVLQRRRTWVAEWEQETKPKEADVRDRIRQEISLEIKNCENMIQAQYDRLDKETSDGLVTIGDRMDFFFGLYTVAGLERCKFEYVDLVRDSIADKRAMSAAKKEVEQHYLFLTP